MLRTRTAGPRIATGLAALVAATGALLVAPTPAGASANGCVGHGFGKRDVTSCITVHGAGTFVNDMAGGVDLSPYTSAAGHFHINGGGLDVTTADGFYDNRSFKTNTKYGPTIPVGHDVPSGSSICASFIEKQGTGYVEHRPACVGIHR
jgi:hypothetical protein